MNKNDNKYWKYKNQKPQQQWFLTGALFQRTKYCVAISRKSLSPKHCNARPAKSHITQPVPKYLFITW